MAIAGMILLPVGAAFILLGVVGVIRMPDVINKLQAGTKATTLGLLSLVLGVLLIRPEWWGKLLLIGLFVLFTNPIGSHNLARAAHGRGEELKMEGRDRLREARGRRTAGGTESSPRGEEG